MITIEEILTKAIEANIHDYHQDIDELKKVTDKIAEQKELVKYTSNILNKISEDLEIIYYGTSIRIRNYDLIEALGYYNNNEQCRSIVDDYAAIPQLSKIITEWKIANSKDTKAEEKLNELRKRYKELSPAIAFSETAINYLILSGYVARFNGIYSESDQIDDLFDGPIINPRSTTIPQMFITAKQYIAENENCIQFAGSLKDDVFELSIKYIDFLMSESISHFNDFERNIHSKFKFYKTLTQLL